MRHHQESPRTLNGLKLSPVRSRVKTHPRNPPIPWQKDRPGDQELNYLAQITSRLPEETPTSTENKESNAHSSTKTDQETIFAAASVQTTQVTSNISPHEQGRRDQEQPLRPHITPNRPRGAPKKSQDWSRTKIRASCRTWGREGAHL